MTKLMEAILDERVQSPHYFQGRLLTASDLAAERDSHLARQRFLGRAIGSGVVEGLWVELADDGAVSNTPSVSVSGGLAINPEGQLLSLEDTQTLILADVLEESVADAGLFSVCEPPETDAVPTGEGFYLLLVQPVSDFREQAQMSSINVEKAGAGCGSKWAIPGVRFRLVQLNPLNVPGSSDAARQALEATLLESSSTSQISRLRNVVANLCLGSECSAAFAVDPFAEEDGEPALTSYGAVDYLCDKGVVTECDVPLALIYWTGAGLEIVDCWAVRRRPVPRSIAPAWPAAFAVRQTVEAQARFFQFQRHLKWLLDEATSPATLQAIDYFHFLPPAGIVPLIGGVRSRGFQLPEFFAEHLLREPVFADGANLRPILSKSLQYPTFVLADEEVIWLYWLRQNLQPPAGETEPPAPPVAVFTSPFMPFFGDPRYDVTRWDYGNYTSISV